MLSPRTGSACVRWAVMPNCMNVYLSPLCNMSSGGGGVRNFESYCCARAAQEKEANICACDPAAGGWKWSSVGCQSWIWLLRIGAVCTIACLSILFSVFLFLSMSIIHILNTNAHENCVHKKYSDIRAPKKGNDMRRGAQFLAHLPVLSKNKIN
jgi:hypothetical protein